MALAVVLLARAVGLAVRAVVGTRRVPGGRLEPTPSATVDPRDLVDLDARFGAIEREEAERRDAVLAVHLRPLVLRAVPVRVVEPVPLLGASRIRFADGTTVVAHGDAPGDMGVLASAIRKHSVRPGSCSTDATGTHLVLRWSGGQRQLSVVVTGFDQPD